MEEVTKTQAAMKKAERMYKALERKCEEHTEAGLKAATKFEKAKSDWMEALLNQFANKE